MVKITSHKKVKAVDIDRHNAEQAAAKAKEPRSHKMFVPYIEGEGKPRDDVDDALTLLRQGIHVGLNSVKPPENPETQISTEPMSPADKEKLDIILTGIRWMDWKAKQNAPLVKGQTMVNNSRKSAAPPVNNPDQMQEMYAEAEVAIAAMRGVANGLRPRLFAGLTVDPGLPSLCNLDLSRVDIDQDSMTKRMKEYVDVVLGHPQLKGIGKKGPPVPLQTMAHIALYHNESLYNNPVPSVRCEPAPAPVVVPLKVPVYKILSESEQAEECAKRLQKFMNPDKQTLEEEEAEYAPDEVAVPLVEDEVEDEVEAEAEAEVVAEAQVEDEAVAEVMDMDVDKAVQAVQAMQAVQDVQDVQDVPARKSTRDRVQSAKQIASVQSAKQTASDVINTKPKPKKMTANISEGDRLEGVEYPGLGLFSCVVLGPNKKIGHWNVKWEGGEEGDLPTRLVFQHRVDKA